MGRAHDPRSAAIGGSCEDRRVEESPRGGRHTVTQAGPLGALQWRSGPACLWRAAQRLRIRFDEPHSQLEAEAIENLGKDIPDFRAGDTVRVGVRVVEGNRERVQNFEGVVIARSNRGMGSNFTVRKMSFGEGVERVFPLYSPILDSVTVVRRGIVRRAKLYYLRGRTGKRARIAERRDNAPKA